MINLKAKVESAGIDWNDFLDTFRDDVLDFLASSEAERFEERVASVYPGLLPLGQELTDDSPLTRDAVIEVAKPTALLPWVFTARLNGTNWLRPSDNSIAPGTMAQIVIPFDMVWTHASYTSVRNNGEWRTTIFADMESIASFRCEFRGFVEFETPLAIAAGQSIAIRIDQSNGSAEDILFIPFYK